VTWTRGNAKLLQEKGMVTLQPDWMVTRPRGPKASRSPVAVIQVLALAAAAALLLSLATLHLANTEINSKSIMVVRYACMGCQGGPSYFSTMQAATSHYTNSRLCRQTQKGIATVVLPNRPSDAEAGGSGAAQEWRGQQRHGAALARPPRLSAAGSVPELHM
jgi:hypothetical protein